MSYTNRENVIRLSRYETNKNNIMNYIFCIRITRVHEQVLEGTADDMNSNSRTEIYMITPSDNRWYGASAIGMSDLALYHDKGTYMLNVPRNAITEMQLCRINRVYYSVLYIHSLKGDIALLGGKGGMNKLT